MWSRRWPAEHPAAKYAARVARTILDQRKPSAACKAFRRGEPALVVAAGNENKTRQSDEYYDWSTSRWSTRGNGCPACFHLRT